jgi:hypothetical protein
MGDLVLVDPPFGALLFTVDEVQSVLLELDVSRGAGPMAYCLLFRRTVHPLLSVDFLFF